MTPAIITAINAERLRADALHGEMSISADGPTDFFRVTVLTEELGEVSRAALDGDQAQLRKELIELAAASIAWAGRLP